ncbi:hypothetical protein AXA65_06565 [Chryseobacterium sp. FP211-J200]|nr:hypothetical protein AXA65_06565 [Chryseobacterium sp. FP211-J200]
MDLSKIKILSVSTILWKRVFGRKHLIEYALSIDCAKEILNTVKNHIIKSKKGKGGGTYSHKSIAYFRTISANF